MTSILTLASVEPFSAIDFPKHQMFRSYNVHLVCDFDQRGSRLSTSLIAVIEHRLLPRQGSSSAQENTQLKSLLEVTNHHQHSRTYKNDICVLGEGAG